MTHRCHTDIQRRSNKSRTKLKQMSDEKAGRQNNRTQDNKTMGRRMSRRKLDGSPMDIGWTSNRSSTKVRWTSDGSPITKWFHHHMNDLVLFKRYIRKLDTLELSVFITFSLLITIGEVCMFKS
jgi:hypothetical protein